MNSLEIYAKSAWQCAPMFVVLAITVLPLDAQYASECTTPTNELGHCMPIYSCTSILSRLQVLVKGTDLRRNDEANFVRLSNCGIHNGVRHVCCAKEHIQLNPRGLGQLENVTCGQYSTPRVSRGVKAELFGFPWMVLLKYKSGKMFRCGGTLITERYVLTAAHCVLNLELILTEVRLGEYNLTSEQDCIGAGRKIICAPPVEDVGISKIIKHENYLKLQIHDDIALLRLNRSVEFQKHIRPICLPITAELMIKTPDDYIVSGWGNTEQGDTSDVLQWAIVPHRARSECERKLPRLRGLTEGHICAGGEDRVDSCKGDSGGPISSLVDYRGKLRLVQFGVVSFGISSCGAVSVPGVYSNVSYYLQWITDHMAANA